MNQSNTRVGDIPVTAGVDLRGKEGFLVKLVNGSGGPRAVLPSQYTDLCVYLVMEGAEQGGTVSLRPLSPDRNVRVPVVGGCAPGELLVLADMIETADVGKVRSLPDSPGTYRGFLVAEENAVDGQWVLARPVGAGLVLVG